MGRVRVRTVRGASCAMQRVVARAAALRIDALTLCTIEICERVWGGVDRDHARFDRCAQDENSLESDALQRFSHKFSKL